MNINKPKKGFTLIEMLIVIVIIGILAAAIFPKLGGAQGRARDTARKGSLQQVATALVSYQIDKGTYPIHDSTYTLSGIANELLSAGLDGGIPTDPNPNRRFDGIGDSNTTITNGQYGYTEIIKFGISSNAFVLMSATETEGGSNRIYDGNTYIAEGSKYDEIITCTEFTQDTTNTNNNNGSCIYVKNNDVLRYIYKY